jgi:hypothetical protein
VRVQLLYFDGCPNWEVESTHLRDALVAVGLAEWVELVEVTAPEQAERLGFRGSPTTEQLVDALAGLVATRASYDT